MKPFWIYAFRDSRYERGVKIGFCSSNRAKNAWVAAPSYAPAPMFYIAGWRVAPPYRSRSGGLHATKENLERHLQRLCGLPLSHQRCGEDWIDTDEATALRVISKELDKEPDVRDLHLTVKTDSDNLRWPRPVKSGNYRIDLRSYDKKVAVWIYEDGLTGRLKTQYVHDWASPRETRRRYSRNGFAERAAYTYEGMPSGDGNWSVYEAWKTVMNTLGPGPGDEHFGWLLPEASLEDVRALYRTAGLVELDIRSSQPPAGIRAAYNR